MHIIHDIAFEVTVDTENQRISWEQYYADFLKNKLLPRVETICDDWSKKHPNTKCTIDFIEVNVEVDSLNLATLQKEIIQQINRQLTSIQLDGNSSDGKLKAVISSKASMFDALLLYLSSGILPSHCSVKAFKEWLSNSTEFNSAEKTKLSTLFTESTDAIQRILSLLQNDYTAFSALIDTKQHITSQYVQLEASFFKQFLKAIFDGFQLSYSDETANIWYKTLGKTNSLAQFSKTFLQLLHPKVISEGKRLTHENGRYITILLLQAILQDQKGKAVSIAVSNIGKMVKDANAANPKDTKDRLKATKASNTETKESEKGRSHAEIQNDQTNSKTEKNADSAQLQADTKLADNSENNKVQSKTEKANTSGKILNEVENTTANRSASHLAKADTKKIITQEITLTTEKAGLVLLHPFLSTFFNAAKVISAENELLDVEKACLLLHYLATETDTVSDVELALEKILLGIPVATMVDCQIALTQEEKALCDELLQAVLTHWVVLKKSTVNTLRDMFLKRDGWMTITEESIKLKIERLAQDILLEKIPWNTSLFRLKWMEKIVHIEW